MWPAWAEEGRGGVRGGGCARVPRCVRRRPRPESPGWAIRPRPRPPRGGVRAARAPAPHPPGERLERGPPRAPRPPAPLPGLPGRGRAPRPSRAPSPGRAPRGRAWRPRGAPRRRARSPWRPEEAAVRAAGRTKRGAPLPAIVRPRPPAERWDPGDSGGRGGMGAPGTPPPAASGPAPPAPALTPGLHPGARPGLSVPRTCFSRGSSPNAGGGSGGPGRGHPPLRGSDSRPSSPRTPSLL